jgi:hypothetical protein
MQLFKGGPGQLGACLGDGAAMNRFRFGPEAAASGLAEKRAGFAIDALALATSRQRQQKDDERGESEFALTNKGLRGKMAVVRGKAVRNELEKSIQNGRKLA